MGLARYQRRRLPLLATSNTSLIHSLLIYSLDHTMSFSSIQSIANVFSNSLLFSMIIDEVNDTDRVSLSCTSKSLESVTTPYIWRELDTLVPLVELLRPLRRENDAFDERRRGFKTLVSIRLFLSELYY